MCEIFDMSRTVARRTFQELVNEGYLIKKKAKCTFIIKSNMNEKPVQKLKGGDFFKFYFLFKNILSYLKNKDLKRERK